MKKTLSIGRDPSCDIVLYDPTNVVSRYHASLRVDGKKWYITDYSTNGTYRNGIRLTPNMEYRVTKDDDVTFGDTVRLEWDTVQGLRRSSGPFWICLLITLLLLALAAGLYWMWPYFGSRQDPGTLIQPPTVVDTTAVAPAADTLVVLENEKAKASKPKRSGKSKAKSSKASGTAVPPVAQKNMAGYTDEDDEKASESTSNDAL